MVSAVILQRPGQPLLPESSLALAEAAARSTGAIRDWRLLGPLGGNNGWDALDQPYSIESQAMLPDFAARYLGKRGGVIGWQNVTTGTSFAAMLPVMQPPTNDYVAFAFSEHVQATAGPVLFIFSLSGVAKIWLNGALVARDELDAGLLAAEQTVPVTMVAGKNTILVKTVNNWGYSDWTIHLSVLETLNR